MRLSPLCHNPTQEHLPVSITCSAICATLVPPSVQSPWHCVPPLPAVEPHLCLHHPLSLHECCFLPQSQWKTRNPPEAFYTAVTSWAGALLSQWITAWVCVCVCWRRWVCVTANEKELYGLWRMNLLIFCWTCRIVAVYFLCSHNNYPDPSIINDYEQSAKCAFLSIYTHFSSLSHVTFQLEQVGSNYQHTQIYCQINVAVKS